MRHRPSLREKLSSLGPSEYLVLLITLVIFFCIPFIWMFSALSYYNPIAARRRRKRNSEIRGRSPPPLGPRKRALTLCSVSVDEDESHQTQPQSAHLQDQSVLFQQFPPEIRQLIYRAVLVLPHGEELGIYPAYGRLYSVSSSGRDDEAVSVSYEYQRKLGPKEMRRRRNRVAGLLCCCRRVYSESISLLYTENTFHVQRPRTIPEMQATILPHRFQSIRSLHLDFVLSDEWSQWRFQAYRVNWWPNMWAIIGMMRDLRSLCVSLGCRMPRPQERELVWALDCLMPFRVKEFQVRFRWLVEVEKIVEGLGGEVPFEIMVDEFVG